MWFSGKVTEFCFIFSYSTGTESARNGTFPNIKEYRVAPSAQTSAALPQYSF